MSFNCKSLTKTSFLKWNYSQLACPKQSDNTNHLSQTVPSHPCHFRQWHLFHLLSSKTSESSLISLTHTPYLICQKALLTPALKYIEKITTSHRLPLWILQFLTWISDVTSSTLSISLYSRVVRVILLETKLDHVILHIIFLHWLFILRRMNSIILELICCFFLLLALVSLASLTLLDTPLLQYLYACCSLLAVFFLPSSTWLTPPIFIVFYSNITFPIRSASTTVSKFLMNILPQISISIAGFTFVFYLFQHIEYTLDIYFATRQLPH